MPSAEEVDQLRRANAELSRRVRGELDDFLSTVSYSRPEAVRDALLQVVPALVEEYGVVAATLSAEWFERTYGVEAVLAAPVAREAVERAVRHSAGALWTDAPDLIRGSLTTKLDVAIKQPGRDSIARSSERHGLTWVRVPRGPKTCAFCLLLASRGTFDAGYRSRDAAIFRADGEKYHGDCDCQAIAVRGPDDYPGGFDPDEAYALYDRAATTVFGDGARQDINAVVYEMRRQNPSRFTDGVVDPDR